MNTNRREPLYLAHYIERAGTGTLDMIRLCREAGLPEPEFRHEGERFVVVIWRDWLTDAVMAGLGLNERQRKVIRTVRGQDRVTNSDYRRIAGTIKKTASRDLDDLVVKGIFVRVGTTGRGTWYCLAAQGDTNRTKETSNGGHGNGDIKGTNET